MKKNIFKILCLLIVLISLSTLIYAKADSGWDTDYSSGSSSSYGGRSSYSDNYSWSSHDYGSSSSRRNSSSRYSNDGIILFEKADKVKVFLFFLLTIGSWFLLPVFAFILSYLFSKNKKNNNQQKKKNNYYDITNEYYSTFFDCDINVLKKQLYNNFYNIQESWMNFDYDNLRKLCTDELYNQYKTQLEVAHLKNEQNIMSDFTLNDIKIYRISEINNVTVVNVYLDVTFKDYVINNKTKDIVRGDNQLYVNNCYLLEFVKSNSSKFVNCPSCGAKIKVISSNICPHCKNTIVQTSNELVLSRKKIIYSNKSK